MNNFDAQLLRLKQALGVTEDQEAAKALGLSKAAFSDRKRRDAFPDDKLYALAAQKPELRIDTAYVLLGEKKQSALNLTVAQLEVAMAYVAKDGMPLAEQLARAGALVEALNAPLPSDEQALLDAYRQCDEQAKKAVVALARDGVAPKSAKKQGKPVTELTAHGHGMNNFGAGAVQVGRAGGKVVVKKGK